MLRSGLRVRAGGLSLRAQEAAEATWAPRGRLLAYGVMAMSLGRALCPVIAVIAVAGCGANHRASRAPPPNRVRQLVERHQVFGVRVPKPSNLVGPQKTLTIR